MLSKRDWGKAHRWRQRQTASKRLKTTHWGICQTINRFVTVRFNIIHTCLCAGWRPAPSNRCFSVFQLETTMAERGHDSQRIMCLTSKYWCCQYIVLDKYSYHFDSYCIHKIWTLINGCCVAEISKLLKDTWISILSNVINVSVSSNCSCMCQHDSLKLPVNGQDGAVSYN